MENEKTTFSNEDTDFEVLENVEDKKGGDKGEIEVEFKEKADDCRRCCNRIDSGCVSTWIRKEDNGR